MTDKQIARAWYKAMKAGHKWATTWGKEKSMNLALIQRPKKVSASSKHLYIYAPSVLMEGFSLKAESIIKILEVHEGPTPEETTLKVIEHKVWQIHTRRRPGWKDEDSLCTFVRDKRGDYETGKRPVCNCEKPLAEMPDNLREATHYVLLSDIGK